MALHLNSSQGWNEIRRGKSHTLSPHPFASRMGNESSTIESFSTEFRRDRSNVRPYVRSSAQKLKWTQELHECFMCAVFQLGGQDKATPKKIQQHMNKEGITIAHIKSHLQMYRSGRINTDGMPKSDFKSWQGGRWLVNSGEKQDRLAIGQDPTHSASKLEELSRNLELEPAAALIQLKTGRNSELLRGTLGNHGFQGHMGEKSGGRMQLDYVTMSGINEKTPQFRENGEQESFEHTLDETPNYRVPPSLKPFISDNSEDSTNSLSTRKRKAKGIEFNLTMPNRSLRPSFSLPCPSTVVEPSLRLALSSMM